MAQVVDIFPSVQQEGEAMISKSRTSKPISPYLKIANIPGFKYLVTKMVCWATGGPQTYTGRSMRESHEELKITEPECSAFMDDLKQTLDKFDVPPAEQNELKAIVESTKADIVLGA